MVVSEDEYAAAEQAAVAAQAAEANKKRLSHVSHLDASVRQAITTARSLIDHDDVFGAERVLLDAVGEIRNAGATLGQLFVRPLLVCLRASDEYRETLCLLRMYERAVTTVLGGCDDASDTDWKIAAEVPVDYPKLGMTLSTAQEDALPKEDRLAKIYWRMPDGKLEVRISMAVPTVPANSQKSLLTAWCALQEETFLYHTWHPIVYGDGPTLLQQRELSDDLVQNPDGETGGDAGSPPILQS